MKKYFAALVFVYIIFGSCLLSADSVSAAEVSVYISSAESGSSLQLLTAEFDSGVTSVSADLFFNAVNLRCFYDGYSNMYVSDGNTEIYCCVSDNVFILKKSEPENCVVYRFPAFRRDCAVFIPLRLIAECFGYTVAWDGNTRSVYLSKLSEGISEALPSEYESVVSESERLRLFCMLKRAALEALYGVSIKYSSETEGYSPGGKEVLTYLSDDEVFAMLSRIENVLGLYSAGFFSSVSQHGVNLNFYLVSRFRDGLFTGLTDKQDKNNIIITITNCDDFERVANHEIMHYIESAVLSIDSERRLGQIGSDSSGFPRSCFSLWSKYNPSGFSYGILNSEYVDNTSGDAYFTDVYSKINEREDRANVFEALMSGDFQKSSGVSQCLLAKARYLIFEISSRLPFTDFLEAML